ncbi:hypothetical protein DL98DRAFT_628569 [Cadophora sp. DSE1049]|nr:hypothetical protein DL98DRAFT_628569 [Cadophora sp. DSE1049]
MVPKLLEAAVLVNGLDQAMMLRLKCLTLRSCEPYQTPRPSNRQVSSVAYCGERLISGYLFARTLADTQRRHFFSKIICETVDDIIKKLPACEHKRIEYQLSLSMAVVRDRARGHPTSVYEFLVPDSETRPGMRDYRMCTVEGNSLAAAAYLNIKPLFLQLVQKGIKDARTCFGPPCDITKRYCDSGMIMSIISTGSDGWMFGTP